METLDRFLEKINKNRIYAGITAVLFPLILAVFSFCKVNKGLDITDSAFNPYNYLHAGSLNDTWFYAYFLTNALGALFGILPGGRTMLGMNVYTGLVKLILGLLAYFFFVRKTDIRREYAFAGVLTALGLCWCPTTVMYNYLTYLLFFLGAAFLYEGLVKDRNILLLIAGVILGLNVFVRFPNLCEAGLILALWFYSFLQKESFKTCLKKTGICILGYAIALAVGFAAVMFTKNGIAGFADGIKGLFAMTKEAKGYAPEGMLEGIFNAYRYNWFFTERTILALLLVTLISLMLPVRFTLIRYGVATLVTGGLLVMLYRNGLFSLDHTGYAAIYSIGILVTEITFLFCFASLFTGMAKNDRLLAFLAMLVILITPLGTNNHLYAVINNCFFTLPVLIGLLFRQKHMAVYFKPINYALLLIVLLFAFQAICFGARFVFRDGVDEPMDTKVEGHKSVAGMYTTRSHAEELKGLFKYVDDELKYPEDGKVLLFGEVSGLDFYLEREVPVGFAWPSLDSYPNEVFRDDIDSLISAGEKPLVIIGARVYEEILNGEFNYKKSILKEFLGNNGYEIGYYSERLVALSAGRNGD